MRVGGKYVPVQVIDDEVFIKDGENYVLITET